MDKDNKQAVVLTGILYFIFALVITFVVNWQDEYFRYLVWAFLWLPVFILFFEAVSQAAKGDNKNGNFSVSNLVLKGIFISLAMSYLSFFVISYGLIVFLDDDKMTKSVFNILIILSFLLTFAFYYMYRKYRVPEFIERLLKRFTSKGKNDHSSLEIEVFKEKAVKERVAKIIDLITILATVFLLSNSTFTTLNPAELNLAKPFDSLEFRLLVLLLPIYVQSAYYKISL